MCSSKKLLTKYFTSVLMPILILLIIFSAPAAAQAGNIIFYGHGYGHGVGLSMTSVFFMSGGDDPAYSGPGGYQNILKYFYTGVALANIDDNTIIRVQKKDDTIVNISMRDYLYREAEEPDSWPEEGLKATMVAMRTYAWNKVLTKNYVPNWGQAWNPAIDPATKPNIVAAVNATAGQILTYGGTPIVAAYSSSAGGYTAGFEDAWPQQNSNGNWVGSPRPYAVPKPAPWDMSSGAKNANWQKTVSAATIEAAYPAIGRFVSLQVIKRSGHGDWGGRAVAVRLVGANGSYETSGNKFAKDIGLRSNYFTFSYDYSHATISTMASNMTPLSMRPVWDSGINNWDWRASKLVARDFNRNGFSDLAVLYGYGGSRSMIWTFIDNGTGFDSPFKGWDSGPGNWDWTGSKLAGSDINGDGLGDIAVLYGYGGDRTRLWIFPNNGVGKFLNPTLEWDSGPGNWAWRASKFLSGDFNGDGKDDLAVLYGYGGDRTRLWIFSNNGDGSFSNPHIGWDSGPGNWAWRASKFISGDFNGDGKDDLAVLYGYGGSQSRLWVFINNGSGGFNAPVVWWDSGPGNWQWRASKLVSGDFSGDGKDDLMVFYGYGGALTKSWLFTSGGNKFSTSLFWEIGRAHV